MDDEKDRFGELLRLLERAREDIYFSAKDRELIEKLKARLRERQPPAAAHLPPICPECGGKLRGSSIKEVPVSRCENCGGAWLKQGELEAILEKVPRRPFKSLVEKFIRRHAAA